MNAPITVRSPRHLRQRLLPLLCLAAGAVPLALATGQAAADTEHDLPVTYEVQLLPTFGGNSSRGGSIDLRGNVAGFSTHAGNEVRRATLWRDGEPTDLGTLGGPNSAVVWNGLNQRGMVVGIAETDIADPLGATWSCSFFFPTLTGKTCLGFVWSNGNMQALPTLGGNNGYATAINNRGQIVGWAETDTPDATCNPPQVLGFRAVLWTPKRGGYQARELPPYPGHTASAATAINERGQVVGISGTCDNAFGRFSAERAVLWDKDRVIDIGNLGGIAWNTPVAINERGDIVGFSNLPGDEDGAFTAHAFLWTDRDGMTDLETLPGNTNSQAHGINLRRQIVGVATGGEPGTRAFYWEDGHMHDLNDLAPDFEGTLLDARHINERSEITGSAIDPDTGLTVPFVATPVRRPGH